MTTCKPFGPQPASILIIGEAPGEQELAMGQPFVGASGQELTRMLTEAGIARASCRVTNVTPHRPPNNDISHFFGKKSSGFQPVGGRYPSKEITEGLELLRQEIESTAPNIIIPLGDTALWALTGHGGITKWRGSNLRTNGRGPVGTLSREFKVVPTYHPAAILRQWSWRYIAVNDLRRAKRKSETFRPEPERETNFIIEPDFRFIQGYLGGILEDLGKGPRRLSVDIETTGRHMSLIGIATSPLNAVCIPLMTRNGTGHYWPEHEEQAIIALLRQVFQHPNAQLIGQNHLYDAQYFVRQAFIWPRFTFDTMLAHHTCFPGLPKSLDFLSSMYLDHHVYWKDELKDYRELPVDEMQFRTYNCKDTTITFELANVLQDVVLKMGVKEQFQFQMDICRPLLWMMLRGVKIDGSKRKELAKEISGKMAEHEIWFQKTIGTFVGSGNGKAPWYNSPQQTATLLYKECNAPEVRDRKTGSLTTKDEALTKIGAKLPILRPLCHNLADYRSLRVVRDTFLEAPVDADGRMRCSYNPAGTVTFRLASSESAFGSGTNLQNLPPIVRKMFVPDADHILLEWDLKQADFHVVVWEADEPALKQMLREGKDPYTVAACHYYNVEKIEKKDPRRQTFKSVIHATDYAGGARTIAATLGLHVAAVDATQRWWFQRYPRMQQWIHRVDGQLKTTRRVGSRFGYHIIFFDRIEGCLSEALAWLGQHTVAITINKGLLNIFRNLPWVEPLLQVHDSIVMQIHKSDFTPERLAEIKAQLLITIPFPNDPLIIPIEAKASASSWADCAALEV